MRFACVKRTTLCFFIFFWLILSLQGRESRIRDTEPLDTIVNQLEFYIHNRLEENRIPGIAVALIRDGKLAWKKGFGVTNSITKEPLTSETLFEVASISKVITAYAALRLVDQGKLNLDKPASSYLSEQWLPPSEHRDKITIRHLLSHSSGLPYVSGSKKILFEPGTRYNYSANGFLYLQEIIQQVTGQKFEDVIKKEVFEPLGMTSSSLIIEPQLMKRTANGHLRRDFMLNLILHKFGILILVAIAVGIILFRLFRGKWIPTIKELLWMIFILLIFIAIAAYIIIDNFFFEFWWLLIIYIALLMIALTALFYTGKLCKLLFLGKSRKRRTNLCFNILWGVLSLVVVVLLAGSITNIPVPRWPQVKASAKGSLRTTVGDLSSFLLELANPKYLSKEMGGQLRTPQLKVKRGISWGLGPCIQSSQQGDALWQWGETLDFQSLMVIYPDRNIGFVGLSNQTFPYNRFVQQVAYRALGGRFDGINSVSALKYTYESEKKKN